MYCTLDDLLERMPREQLTQLSDDGELQNEPNQEVIDSLISSAGDIVDGYLRGRYQLPLSPVPPLIKRIVVDLVVLDLWARRPQMNGELPKAVERAHGASMELLKHIQTGKVTLGASELPDASPHGSQVRVNHRRRVFNDRTLRAYTQSELGDMPDFERELL